MLIFVRSLGLFSDVLGLLLVAASVRGVGSSLVSVFDDTKMVIETLLCNALAPAIALDLFNVVLELLTVGKAFVALDGVVIGLELLLLSLLNGFALLKPPALLKLELFVDPAPRKLVQVLF